MMSPHFIATKIGSAHFKLKEMRRPTNDYITSNYISGPTKQPLANKIGE